MSLVSRLVLALSLLTPMAALASGAHDSVGCVGCHSIHGAKGDIIFAVAPNKSNLNPKTKQAFSGTTALCLGCHEESTKGGQGYAPVHANMSHPYGLASVDPRIAKVPGELLQAGGRFECLGCHDPHPSNPNYKYLRVDTGSKGQNMDPFCAVCHPIKADASAVATRAALFTSMDETGNRALKAGGAAKPGVPAAKPVAPPPAPAKKK
jgi:predicted CXXCH cytochrome family protein